MKREQREERRRAAEDRDRDKDDDGDDDRDDDERDDTHRPQLPALLLAAYHDRLVRERGVRQRRLALFLAIFVALPTLLSAIVFGFVITPRYVSEAQITVHSDETQTLGLLSSILGSVGSGSSSSSIGPVLVEYIHSEAILDTLQGWLDLKQHYSQERIDTLTRLSDTPTREDFLDYYRSRVEAVLDTETSIISLRVQAFDPDYAQALGEAIIALSEGLANSLSERSREDSVSFARQEVQRAEERLRNVRLKLVEFRNERRDLDPLTSAASISGIVSGIEQQLSAARTEMAGMKAFMREDSPQMIALKARVAALMSQLQEEKSRLTGKAEAGEQQPYNEVLAAYEAILIEEEFARTGYASASAALEAARVGAARQTSYLVDFVPPMRPDEALEPDVGRAVLTTFLLSLLTFALGGLLVTAIREQAGL